MTTPNSLAPNTGALPTAALASNTGAAKILPWPVPLLVQYVLQQHQPRGYQAQHCSTSRHQTWCSM